ncbi:phosphopantetheine-binding protein [Amylibacter marinus]|uniref:Phosphopantetheine-binding protein n=1 Tax=Amylibacter marinus TaxID=1475483 RepID=A0ABQ5VTJ5_9RHOB|nr:phosphopantetheine-binding protein [Amylibacter marinus]GLQ34438.1 phosphopantetheine-binding protein [Amylibacter marinus]
MSDVQSRIIEIIAEQAMLTPADIAPDSTLEDLALDSLALVETIFAIEEGFGITVPFNANNPEDSEIDFTSVASLTKAVEALIKQQSA